jgi:2-(1,2-epoxy-1,2-dihydrophenyl)acetyl-CoA isomerase
MWFNQGSTIEHMETVMLSVADGIATVTLNRPDRFNALNLQMAQELYQAAIACGEDPAIRAVVITGAGKAFFAGGDLSAFAEAGAKRGALIREMTASFHAAISRFNSIDAPVIAAVNGVAAGAGFSMMLACDLVVARKSAKFTMAYTKAGLAIDGGSSYFLARIVGLRRAQELMLTNRTLSADEALEWGLLTRVVDDTDFDASVSALASEIASGPTRSFGAAKRLIRRGLDESLESQMECETGEMAMASLRKDGLEGVDAFLNKRAATFTGE